MRTIITFLATAVCTVLLYHLIFEEHTDLFYINVVTTCIAEGIILCGLPLFSSEKLLTFKNAASWTILNIFAILIFAWTTLFTVAFDNGDNLDTLYIGQLVIGILFIVLFGITETGGHAMQKQEETLQATIKSKKRVLISVDSYWLDAKETLSNYSDWGDEILYLYRITLDKIKAIPAEKLERNGDIMDDIREKLDAIKELIENLSTDESLEKQQQNITKRINSLKNYITTIKFTL